MNKLVMIIADWSHSEAIGLYLANVALARGLQILGLAPLLGPNDTRMVVSIEGDPVDIELARTEIEEHSLCCFAS